MIDSPSNNARSRSFHSVTGTGNDHFAAARKACDDRANGIVTPVTGAFGFRNSQLHELLSRSVGSRNHLDGLYQLVPIAFQDNRKCPALCAYQDLPKKLPNIVAREVEGHQKAKANARVMPVAALVKLNIQKKRPSSVVNETRSASESRVAPIHHQV